MGFIKKIILYLNRRWIDEKNAVYIEAGLMKRIL